MAVLISTAVRAVLRPGAPVPDLLAREHRHRWERLLAEPAEAELTLQLRRLLRLPQDHVVAVYLLLQRGRLWQAGDRAARRISGKHPWFKRQARLRTRLERAMDDLERLYQELVVSPELRDLLGVKRPASAYTATRNAIEADPALSGRLGRRRGHQPEQYKRVLLTGLRELGVRRTDAEVWLRLIGVKPPIR